MGIIYNKYLYSEAISLLTVFTLSACAKPKLDAKLSVNDIVYMSRRAFKLKDDQILVEASFKLEDISEDMKNELKTSAKQFYLKDEDGKTTTNVKKTVDAYFNAVLLGGESKDYNKFVSTDLASFSQIVFNTAMIKPIISNQLEMKFQKFPDGLKLLTVNGVIILLTTFSLLKIRRSLMLTCQLSV